jgi:hypothetical protein
LLAEHAGSQAIAGLPLALGYGTPAWAARSAAAALRRLLGATQDPSVEAYTLASLALILANDPEAGEAGRAESNALLARIETTHAERDFVGMKGSEFARGARFELEHLRIGETAPDFELVDQAGERFSLREYRGRVVLLDFWGFV